MSKIKKNVLENHPDALRICNAWGDQVRLNGNSGTELDNHLTGWYVMGAIEKNSHYGSMNQCRDTSRYGV